MIFSYFTVLIWEGFSINLNRLKLLCNYKIFKTGTEFKFNNNSKILAVVGVNGSGKSIFQEVIVNVFMNIYAKVNKFKVYLDIDYEFEYSLTPTPLLYSAILNDNNTDFGYENLKEIVVKVISQGKDVFSVKIFYKDRIDSLIELKDVIDFNIFLPSSLVVYSSGENETISNELLRYRLINQDKYFNNMFNFNSSDNYKMNLEYVYNNYRSLLIISILLFDNYKVNKLKDLVEIRELLSFDLNLNLMQRSRTRVELPEREVYNIKKLLGFSSTFYHQNEDNLGDGSYKLVFKNKHKIIKDEYLDDPANLYRTLEYLENLNLLKISKSKRKKLIRENSYSIKDIHSYYSNEKKIFELIDSSILKNDKTCIKILGLSDGEYQVLLIMALLLIHGQKNTLFILDEPDTHLNPEWKSKFVSMISMIKDDYSQCIFSTHNPDVLTDMKSQDIFFFKNGKLNSVDINTFGANPNIISSKIFGKNNTISERARREYERYYHLIEAEDSIETLERVEQEILYDFGNSSERMMLLNKIYNKQRS
ncbi:AAA family ATPase [Priestia megaterium]|uniref:AAA family ATPase n=1 Tax=Priestia megaterium TaxID=1404 RepID=UPI0015D5014E|nr:AAA family ATPase [Priestia megaterium]